MLALGEYLERELRRLDLLLHREILRLRARYQLTLDEFRGLYVGDKQVDALVSEAVGTNPGVDDLSLRAEQLREENASERPEEWDGLERNPGLSPGELDVILLALAREVDLKYEPIFAYLHNDIHRKKPTVELALCLFPAITRNVFLPEGKLFATGLLSTADGSFLGRELVVSLPLLRHLTGLAPESSIPASSVSPFEPLAASTAMARLFLVEHRDPESAKLAVDSACHSAGKRLLTIEPSVSDLPNLAQRIRLLQQLECCGVCLQMTAALLPAEGALPEVRRFFESLVQPDGPIWIPVTPETPWRGSIPGRAVRLIRLEDHGLAARQQKWRAALPGADNSLLEALASRYSLSATQIHAAAQSAKDSILLRSETRAPEWDDLVEAVRLQSGSSLGRHAQRVVCRQSWDDLVLPAGTLRQVREVAGAIRFHHVVYSDWGFGARHSGIEGMKILFAGASGTGKTMTAGVLGKDLGLDVFRVDLSRIVSKYIGETEKNLDRVFQAARGSNSILFFDEADALFGKRSEVKDAHDRYANIEVAYLLQKFEEHDGPVILATNLRRCLDEAFSRRMHYVIEFPQPDEEHRLALWQKIFPPQTPLSGIDFPFLSAQFPLTGGDIKNVALDAALLAAQDGGIVTMRQIAQAMSRQMVKQGRPPAPVDFKQYHSLVPRQGT